MIPATQLVALLLSQAGDEYVFGAEVSPADSNPAAFDCSELIQWGCARLGVTPTVPDGSWLQARHLRNHGTLAPVADVIDTPGALLFAFTGDPFTGGRPAAAHVAMAAGSGVTIEARSTRHGVGSFSVHGRGWTHAGLIPGVAYDPTTHYPPLPGGDDMGLADTLSTPEWVQLHRPDDIDRLWAVGVHSGAADFWKQLLANPHDPQWEGFRRSTAVRLPYFLATATDVAD